MIDLTRLGAVTNGTDIAGIHPNLKLLCAAARAVLDGQDVAWCEEHHSKASASGEVCEGAINIAYRVGRNPYDRISCRMVKRRLVTLEETE